MTLARTTMTADESALLAAIEANPADDLPRLVYADWLEEHGHPIRAEFIRLQCEIAHLETDRRDEVRPHHHGLWQRQGELLAAHRGELLGSLADLPGRAEVKFERGFPSEVELSVTDFLTHGAALDAARPRPRVRVNLVADRLAEFVRSPHLGCVHEIGGYSPLLGAELLFEDQPALPPADELAATASRLVRLEVLDLEGCWLDDAVCERLSRLRFPALVELDLSNNQITDVGVSHLLRGALPRRLILGGNPITDQGAIELADRLSNSPVMYLNLRRTLIGTEGFTPLLNRYQQGGRKVDLF
jgi:uncharacterized protein (TIGR02996 family)